VRVRWSRAGSDRSFKGRREALLRRATADYGTFRVERIGEYSADGRTINLYHPVP
jgi:hypothetical protein